MVPKRLGAETSRAESPKRLDAETSVNRQNAVAVAERRVVRQSELSRSIKTRPRMYVRRSIIYEKAAFCSLGEYSSVAR